MVRGPSNLPQRLCDNQTVAEGEGCKAQPNYHRFESHFVEPQIVHAGDIEDSRHQ